MELDGERRSLLKEMEKSLEESKGEMKDGNLTERVCRGLEILIGQRDLWSCIDEVLGEGGRTVNFNIRKSLETVRISRLVLTIAGKGRMFLRHMLKHKLLYPALDYIAPHPLILSFAAKVDTYDWSLDLENCLWLDRTWELPVQETHLFVPTADLGIAVSLVQGKPIVTKVQSGSVAGEEGKVEVGDVITHINSQIVVNTDTRNGLERILNLLGKSKGKPISITITKAWSPQKMELFSPVIPLMKQIKMNVEDIQKTYFLTKRSLRRRSGEEDEYNPLEEEDDHQDTMAESGYACLYMGSVKMGQRNRIQDIDFGIRTVLSQTPAGLGHPAELRLLELDLRLTQTATNATVMKISYPNITSCGRILCYPKYFAFISSTQAKGVRYMCHVFFTSKEETAKEILATLADGFSRTSCTV